jgi:hypothetical protein
MVGSGWFWVSGLALLGGIVWLAVSGWVGYRLFTELLPLLTETRNQVQDLGDLAANTVGRASDTMDIVEMRVSETMGQATQAGVSVTKQALGVGSALAVVYMVSRGISLLRVPAHARERHKKDKTERNKTQQQHAWWGRLQKKNRT